MTIISSQHYIDQAIVDEKMAELAGCTLLTIQAYEAGEINGEEYAVLFDKHHTLYAAKLLDIPVEVEIVSHPENLTGDRLLEEQFMDNYWYDVMDANPEARRPVF